MKKLISKKNFWLPFILAILVTASAFAVDFASVIQQKIALEKSFEDRLRGLLEKILGTDRFIVIVNVEPETESTEVARETWVQEKATGEVVRKEKKFVLPGVPVREKLGEEKALETLSPGGEMKREYEKVVVLPKSFVRRVLVTIILDEKMEDTVIETVRAVATEIIGLDIARGDQLVIKKQHFSEPSQTAWSNIKSSPIYWLLFSIVFLLFLLFPVRFLLRGPAARIFQTVRPKEILVAPPAPVLGPAATIELGPPEKGKEKIGEKIEEKTSHPFDFINQNNIKHLLYLLKDESAETISVVVSYLSPREATQVMASLPRALKAGVTERLARIREVPPEVVDAMEQNIEEKIGYIVGGTEQLVQIVSEADNITREEMLQSLMEREPELAEKIRKQILTFEDIAKLDNSSFQMVLRQVDLGTVSLALKGTPEGFKQKVMEKLSEGAQAMLKQEMELGKPTGKQKIEEAQMRIVKLVRDLQKEGRIAFELAAEGREIDGSVAVEKETEGIVVQTFAAPEEGRSPAATASSTNPAPAEKSKTKAIWIAIPVIIVILVAGFWWYQRSIAKKKMAEVHSTAVPIEGVKGR